MQELNNEIALILSGLSVFINIKGIIPWGGKHVTFS